MNKLKLKKRLIFQMNNQNNSFNQNIFASQGIPYQNPAIPYSSNTYNRNVPPRGFEYNINNNISNRSMQGFYPNMNMPFNQE
jgi:hypothetical protein